MIRVLAGFCCLGAMAWGAVAQPDFVDAQALAQAGLVKYWQLQLPLDPGQTVRDAHLVDDHLYLGTQDGYVYAVHAPTGVLRWIRPVTRSGYNVRRPCHVGDRVVFVTPVDAQVYQRLTGEPIARRDFRFPAGSAVATDGRYFFVGGIDHRVYAFDVDRQYIQWRAITGGAIESTPFLWGEYLFIADNGGQVNACRARDKVLRWPVPARTFDRITSDLVASDEGLFVPSHDLSLYLLDFDYGRPRWRARFSAPLREPPILTPELAYQYCDADGVAAVEISVFAPERIRWKVPSARSALTVHGQRVFLLTRDGRVLAVKIADGTVEHSIPAAGFSMAMPSPADATIFIASADGRLFCARPRGIPPLKREDLTVAAYGAPVKGEELPSAEASAAAEAKPQRDPLEAARHGSPMGGKSKVSRDFKERSGTE